MTQPPLKLDVMLALPCYGGNGGISSEHPDIRRWFARTLSQMKADPRVGRVEEYPLPGDTPITMVRNRYVRQAQACGFHLLLMVDSDQSPDRHAHEPWYKPFWDVAFDAAYNHYQKGPLVIGAPYCGPPPKENVYVFQFETDMSNIGEEEGAIRLEQYTRSQAAMMTGLGEVAALPTGMILFDMRIFDLYRPSPRHKRIVLRDLAEGKITVRQAEIELQDGWFHYEWTDGYCDQKASTEDVCSTRDMGMCCSAVLGYNPLRCAWDSWIGHHKPWNCGRPNFYKVENVAAAFKQVCASDASIDEKIVSNFRSASIADFPVYQPPENGNGHAKTSKRADRGRAAKPGG